MYYTYILRSKKNKDFYTGYTKDLRKRFEEHNDGKSKYTSTRGPYEIIYYEACHDMDDARSREVYLKSGMGKRYLKARLKRFLIRTG
ncbi:MAG: GIY-YIG nuclease family protein [Patescibacteria group bacterium]